MENKDKKEVKVESFNTVPVKAFGSSLANDSQGAISEGMENYIKSEFGVKE